MMNSDELFKWAVVSNVCQCTKRAGTNQ